MFYQTQTEVQLKCLDLFCGAGGCTKGYQQTGFHVTGVDIARHRNYPGEVFLRMDALEYLEKYGHRFDFIHASPPCQRFSVLTKLHKREKNHPNYIDKTRQLLLQIGKPFVIENVMGSPLVHPVTLCGSMFGLEVRRHRLFEHGGFELEQPRCQHHKQNRIFGVYGNTGGTSNRDDLKFGTPADWQRAMGIDWMSIKQLAQAIPPAYTQHIARSFLKWVRE